MAAQSALYYIQYWNWKGTKHKSSYEGDVWAMGTLKPVSAKSRVNGHLEE